MRSGAALTHCAHLCHWHRFNGRHVLCYRAGDACLPVHLPPGAAAHLYWHRVKPSFPKVSAGKFNHAVIDSLILDSVLCRVPSDCMARFIHRIPLPKLQQSEWPIISV